ncbi:DNA-binding phosphoprotein [Cetacean poxvirus 1]|nr:DNA-binding phosphoprotein [Cetacean poxvirus 1]
MRKSVSKKQTIQHQNDNNNNDRITCQKAIEFLKLLSRTTQKCIEQVSLTPTQYPFSFNISIKLVSELINSFTSTLILIEGEAKLYKNKSKAMESFNKRETCNDAYFLKIKLLSASPMFYQLLECIYSNIRDNKRIPNSLSNLTIEDLEEKTLKDGYLFINRMTGAIIEYKSECEQSIIKPIDKEFGNLLIRDKQVATVILSPVVFYRNGTDTKVTFALRKFTISKECNIKVIGVSGESENVTMNDGNDEDVSKGLGLICDPDDGEDASDALFNI